MFVFCKILGLSQLTYDKDVKKGKNQYQSFEIFDSLVYICIYTSKVSYQLVIMSQNQDPT